MMFLPSDFLISRILNSVIVLSAILLNGIRRKFHLLLNAAKYNPIKCQFSKIHSAEPHLVDVISVKHYYTERHFTEHDSAKHHSVKSVYLASFC